MHKNKMPGKAKSSSNVDSTLPTVNTRKRPASNKKPTDSSDSIPFKKARPSGNSSEPTKPNWKEIKEKQKKLRESRRHKKSNIYDSALSAKKLCEQIRSSNCPNEKKIRLINDVYSLLKGNLLQCAKLHDMSRVLQWIIKLGSTDLKRKVFEEIRPGLVEIALSRYGIHLLKTFLTKPKDSDCSEMFTALKGSIVKLLQNKVSAVFVNTLYTKYISVDDKLLMRQAIFGDLLRTSNAIKSLSEILEDDPALRKPILSSVKKNLLKIIKPTNVSLEIVVDVFYEFLECSNLEEHSELLDAVRPHIIDLATTRTGSKIATHVIWDSTPKAKKMIVKAVKGDIDKIIAHEHQSNLILALVDSVDDTVIMRKAIVDYIINNILEVLKSKSGRRVVLYLVAHRNTRHFHPQEVSFLSQGDTSKHTKKETSIKIAELMSQSADPLLQSIIDNPDVWFSVAHVAYIAYEIIGFFKGNPKVLECYDVLIDYIIGADIENKKESTDLAEDAGAQFIFKKLIVKNHKNSTKEACSGEDCFAVRLSKKIKKDVCLKLITSNRGCFILVHLLESKHREVVKSMYKVLKGQLHVLSQLDFFASSLLSDFVSKVNELGVDKFCQC